MRLISDLGLSPQTRWIAAWLTALAIVASAAACSSASEDNDSSPSATSASPTPEVTGTEPTSTGTIPSVKDLAVDTPVMTVYGRQPDDFLTGGTNIALGDFNADGEPDLLVGAPQADGLANSRPDSGEAYVFFGPLQGEIDLLDDKPDITIYGASGTSSGGDALGFSVFAGDLDQDGIDDVMVGATGVTAGFDPRTDQGRLYVFYGGPQLDDVEQFDLVEDVFDLTVTGSEGFSRLSTDVDLGDVNGDGLTDLLVSSPYAGRAPGTPPGSKRTAEGEIYVIFGTGERLTGEYNMAAGDYDVLLGGSQEFGQFGASFAVGDFNDDGYDDVLAGAYRNDAPDGRPSAGVAYVFLGSGHIGGRLSVLDGAHDVSIDGATAGSAFGLPVAAGDFNNDGYDDMAVGAQTEGINNLAAAGALHIFFGTDDLPNQIDLSENSGDVLVPGSAGASLLPSALAAGDTDGDGIDDVVFTSALGGATLGRSTAGLIYVMPGRADLPRSLEIESGDLPEPIIGPDASAKVGTVVWFGSIGEFHALATLAPGVNLPDRGNVGAVYVVSLE